MVGAPATGFGSACVATDSASGTFQIGSTRVAIGQTDMQFGVSGPQAGSTSLGAIVPAAGNSTLVAAPAKVPGGLLGLMCPAGNALIQGLCNLVANSPLNAVTATVELAGAPGDFNATGALTLGNPILTLPVKVHLRNPLLGASCYIGSNRQPIVLRPQTTKLGAVSSAGFGGGHIGFILTVNGATLADTSFAVPGASGCGGVLAPLIDPVVNLKQGLPSAAGKNALVLDNARASTALTQKGGQVLHDAWHAHCLSGC